MRQQPQFDLRVIGATPADAPAPRQTTCRDPAAFTSVRIGMFCKFGSFDESRPVDAIALRIGRIRTAASIRIDLANQRIRIRRLQLLQLPPIQNPRGQLIPLIGQCLQHRSIRAPSAGLHPPPATQLHLVEQHLTQLLRRTQIKRAPSQPMDILFHHSHALLEIHRHAPQIVSIDLDAGTLHRQQHGDQPSRSNCSSPSVNARYCEAQPRPQHLPQPQRHVCILRRIGGRALDQHGCRKRNRGCAPVPVTSS